MPSQRCTHTLTLIFLHARHYGKTKGGRMHEIQTNVVLTILACCLDSPTFEYIASHGMPADALVLSSGRSFCCVFLSQSVQTGLLLDDPII